MKKDHIEHIHELIKFMAEVQIERITSKIKIVEKDLIYHSVKNHGNVEDLKNEIAELKQNTRVLLNYTKLFFEETQ